MKKILLLYFFSIVRKTIGTIEDSNIFFRLKVVFYLVLSTCEVSWPYDNKLSKYLFSMFLTSKNRPPLILRTLGVERPVLLVVRDIYIYIYISGFSNVGGMGGIPHHFRNFLKIPPLKIQNPPTFEKNIFTFFIFLPKISLFPWM